MVEGTTCASVARARGEDLLGTASTVRRWLLVEQPGPWGPDALVESRVPGSVAEELASRARRHGVRVLLLRKRTRPANAGHHCFVVHSGPGATWAEHAVVGHPAELLDVDLAALGRGRRTGFGTPWEQHLYLVCTHGRHDPCCAQFGRPVVRALRRAARDRVWECSHLGGDRFAANLVCLPYGHYFGRLLPEEAPGVLRTYEAGRLDLAHYRGRSCFPMAVQAAEFFARSRLGIDGAHDLAATAWDRPAPDIVDVRFAAPGGRSVRARVLVQRAAEGRPLTCRASEPAHPPTYSLVRLEG